MKNKLLRRLDGHGYQKIKRNRHIHAYEHELSDAEYHLYDLFISIYDWDPQHEDTFGIAEATDKQLAEVLGWNISKVYRIKKNLEIKLLIHRIEKGCYMVNRPMIIDKKMQEKTSKSNKYNAKSNENSTNMNSNWPQKDNNSLVSSRYDYVSSLPTEDFN